MQTIVLNLINISSRFTCNPLEGMLQAFYILMWMQSLYGIMCATTFAAVSYSTNHFTIQFYFGLFFNIYMFYIRVN